MELVVRAARVVADDAIVARQVGVADGRIVAVEPLDGPPLDAAETLTLAEDEVLLPGLVDAHVHVNEPGRTEWEGFATATRAAAAGGVTTLVDMPLNSIPPTVDVAALDTKRKAAADAGLAVDVGFWGGAVPGNLAELRGLHEAGVFGFKCFLLPSGVDEFPPLPPDELPAVMAEIARLGSLLIVHAEDCTVIDNAPPAHGTRYADFLASRPRDAENRAIAQVIDAARTSGARVHVLHLSSSDALPAIRAARRDGVSITAETCPHYLYFAAEDVPDGQTQYKCCPPIREAANRQRLWDGLRDGDIDAIVSDHSPCTPDLKHLDAGDFGTAWGGIASLQLGLPAIWTQARRRGHTLPDLARWMARRPAEIAGVPRKGAIKVGNDADFCVFAPDQQFVVDPTALHHRHPLTPYANHRLTGTVRTTYLRGTPTPAPARLLTRESGISSG
ncbi:allantoinase AllB [Pseudonocardia acaciae]|uniref:allantoinase AllB n=1 Tax=Pseudonocardia acaciae TaxID=551276 RepID=UPI000B10224D|nr:allantoinase AllB [Pseudonocardia acaciae]